MLPIKYGISLYNVLNVALLLGIEYISLSESQGKSILKI